jgi:hypothetical protein
VNEREVVFYFVFVPIFAVIAFNFYLIGRRSRKGRYDSPELERIRRDQQRAEERDR